MPTVALCHDPGPSTSVPRSRLWTETSDSGFTEVALTVTIWVAAEAGCATHIANGAIAAARARHHGTRRNATSFTQADRCRALAPEWLIFGQPRRLKPKEKGRRCRQ